MTFLQRSCHSVVVERGCVMVFHKNSELQSAHPWAQTCLLCVVWFRLLCSLCDKPMLRPRDSRQQTSTMWEDKSSEQILDELSFLCFAKCSSVLFIGCMWLFGHERTAAEYLRCLAGRRAAPVPNEHENSGDCDQAASRAVSGNVQKQNNATQCESLTRVASTFLCEWTGHT